MKLRWKPRRKLRLNWRIRLTSAKIGVVVEVKAELGNYDYLWLVVTNYDYLCSMLVTFLKSAAFLSIYNAPYLTVGVVKSVISDTVTEQDNGQQCCGQQEYGIKHNGHQQCWQKERWEYWIQRHLQYWQSHIFCPPRCLSWTNCVSSGGQGYFHIQTSEVSSDNMVETIHSRKLSGNYKQILDQFLVMSL